MSALVDISLGAPQRDVLLHALRFESRFIRQSWPKFDTTADAIDALRSKLDEAFQQQTLFDRGTLSVQLSKAERRLAAECLHELGTQLSFFHGNTQGAKRADAVRDLFRAAA